MSMQAPPPVPPTPQFAPALVQPPASEKYNVLAIVSLVSAFLVSLVAVVTGHIALSQIKKSGEKGRGLAIAGLILGYLGILAGIVAAIVLVVLLATGAAIFKAGIDQSQALSSLLPTDFATADPGSGSGSDGSTQTVAEACTILGSNISSSMSAVSDNLGSLQSDPAAAIAALEKLSSDFDAASGSITNPAVLAGTNAARDALDTLITDLQAYVANPGSDTSALLTDSQAAQSALIAVGVVCR
ncbi:hypothetical protein BH09ACT6_BH09ACT6_27550 [soil metagenome]